MNMMKNIIKTLTVVFFMTVSLVSCVTTVQSEPNRYGVGSDVITKERPLGKWTDCRICKGKGTCIDCKGTGKIKGNSCNICSGTGRCTTCEGQGGFRSEE